MSVYSTLESINGHNGLVSSPKDNNPANMYAAQVGSVRAEGRSNITTRSINGSTSGNILTTYNAQIQLSFQGERIMQEQISYILIDNDYDDHTTPIIYVSLAVTNDMYNNIINNKDTATFYLAIFLNNVNSSLSINKQILGGEFTYISSATNPNYAEVLDKSDAFFSDAYKRIVIGLVSTQLNNAARKEFNQIYKDITCETLLSLALEGLNSLVESPTYNDWYESLIVPPMTSRRQLISYLYDKHQFYDTNFRFYMDFNYCYLLSKAGNLVSDGRGNPENIIIDIKELSDRSMIEDGFYVKNGSYYINMNPADTNIIFDQGSDKISNNIVSVSDEGDVTQVKLNINATEGNSTKNFYIRNTNTTLYKNELETDTVAIELIKKHIDPTIFTPNKSISINNYGKYADYNGKYVMKYKKVYFNNTAGSFIVSVILGLKKVNNIIPKARLGANTKPTISVSKSYSASRSSSAKNLSSANTTSKAANSYSSKSASVKYTSDNKSSGTIRGSRAITNK